MARLAFISFVVLSTLAVAFAGTSTIGNVRRQYAKYCQDFNKSYGIGDQEFETRLPIFVRSLKNIEHNNAVSPYAKYGLTMFSDMTDEEKLKFKNPARGPSQQLARSCLAKGVTWTKLHDLSSNSAAPSSWDWRTKGKVTPVKNQGGCGSCWTFSVTGAIESAWAIATNTLPLLSEQEIVDCSHGCTNVPGYGPVCNQGCLGGWPWSAMNDVVSWKGLATETQYPYTAEDGTCHQLSSYNAAPIKNYTCLSNIAGANLANEDTMAAFLAANGPLSIALDAADVEAYNGGIIHGQGMCGQQQLDHAVLAVGYGVGTAAEGNIPFWIVKNSWGASWGENGYFRIARGVNQCGLASAVVFPIVNYGQADF